MQKESPANFSMLYFIGEEGESNRKKDVHMYVKLSKDWDERKADTGGRG